MKKFYFDITQIINIVLLLVILSYPAFAGSFIANHVCGNLPPMMCDLINKNLNSADSQYAADKTFRGLENNSFIQTFQQSVNSNRKPPSRFEPMALTPLPGSRRVLKGPISSLLQSGLTDQSRQKPDIIKRE